MQEVTLYPSSQNTIHMSVGRISTEWAKLVQVTEDRLQYILSWNIWQVMKEIEEMYYSHEESFE